VTVVHLAAAEAHDRERQQAGHHQKDTGSATSRKSREFTMLVALQTHVFSDLRMESLLLYLGDVTRKPC
jgi:hypothetical protein